MQISKKTLATILVGLASVIGIVSIFCFFGACIKLSEGHISVAGPSMFIAMFGGTFEGNPVDLQPGMTVLFVIELIILLLSVVIIAGNVSKKLKETTTICLTSIIAILTLVGVVMSFCTKSLTDSNYEFVKLGAGAISYSVLGIVGIVSNVMGIILYKKSK